MKQHVDIMKVENVLTCALRSDSSVKFYFYYQTLPVILDLHKSNLLFLESHWNPDFPPDCQDLQYYINGRVLGTNGLHRVFVIPDNTFLNHILHWKVILLLAGSYFIIQTGLEYGQMSTSHLLSIGMRPRVYLYIKTHFGAAQTHFRME